MLLIKFFYLIILVGSIIFYVMYVDVFSFYLLLIVGIVPIILFGILMTTKHFLSVSISCAHKSAVCGKAVPVIITLSNRSSLTIPCAKITVKYRNLVYGNVGKTVISTPVYANNCQELCLKITPEYCGSLEVYVDSVRIYDVIKLFSAKIKRKGRVLLTVAPQICAVEPQTAKYSNFFGETDLFSKHQAGDDPSEIFQLHEYRPGDRMNRIHWKASMKKDEYIVKDYSMPLSNNIAFFLCPFTELIKSRNGNPMPSYSSIIKACASLSVALIEKETRHTFIWSARGSNITADVTEEDDYSKFLQMYLSTPVDTSKTYSALKSYLLGVENSGSYAHIIIVTDVCDDELFTLLESDERSVLKTVICCNDNHTAGGESASVNVVMLGCNDDLSSLSDIVI